MVLRIGVHLFELPDWELLLIIKRKKEKLVQEGEKAVEEDGAEVLILGCAGMAGLDKEIEKIVNVPVIDGVVSALMLIESLIRYGVSTSKAGKYS